MLGNERPRRNWTNLWSCFLVGRAGAMASEVTIVRDAEDMGLRAWQSALSFFPIKWWPTRYLPHSVIQEVPGVLKSLWGSLGTWSNCLHGLVSEWTVTSLHDDTQVTLTLLREDSTQAVVTKPQRQNTLEPRKKSEFHNPILALTSHFSSRITSVTPVRNLDVLQGFRTNDVSLVQTHMRGLKQLGFFLFPKCD